MPPNIRHKYKYFHSAVQRAKDRRQKFHFCRLRFDVRPRNVKLNLSSIRNVETLRPDGTFKRKSFFQSAFSQGQADKRAPTKQCTQQRQVTLANL